MEVSMKRLIPLFTFLLMLHMSISAAALAEEKKNSEAITVSIVNTMGEAIGKAILTEQAGKVSIHVEAEKLSPGVHGIHIHETGLCEPPKFTTAGAHFNPMKKEHGFDNPKGFHLGDLPNITVEADGKVVADITSAVITLQPGKPNSIIKQGGTSLIIHAGADDYKTDPSGNSGDRIACGVIQ